MLYTTSTSDVNAHCCLGLRYWLLFWLVLLLFLLSQRLSLSYISGYSAMNNRYRNAPGLRGPTRATASTVCQKCLKRDKYWVLGCSVLLTDLNSRHYSYECNVSAQDRPYLTRPSRTQQLQNPNLKPKLSTEVPNDLLPTYASFQSSWKLFSSGLH